MTHSTEPSFQPVRMLLVVAVALVDADNRVLIAQRPEGKNLSVCGNFPVVSWSLASGPKKGLFGSWRKNWVSRHGKAVLHH